MDQDNMESTFQPHSKTLKSAADHRAGQDAEYSQLWTMTTYWVLSAMDGNNTLSTLQPQSMATQRVLGCRAQHTEYIQPQALAEHKAQEHMAYSQLWTMTTQSTLSYRPWQYAECFQPLSTTTHWILSYGPRQHTEHCQPQSRTTCTLLPAREAR